MKLSRCLVSFSRGPVDVSYVPRTFVDVLMTIRRGRVPYDCRTGLLVVRLVLATPMLGNDFCSLGTSILCPIKACVEALMHRSITKVEDRKTL